MEIRSDRFVFERASAIMRLRHHIFDISHKVVCVAAKFHSTEFRTNFDNTFSICLEFDADQSIILLMGKVCVNSLFTKHSVFSIAENLKNIHLSVKTAAPFSRCTRLSGSV